MSFIAKSVCTGIFVLGWVPFLPTWDESPAPTEQITREVLYPFVTPTGVVNVRISQSLERNPPFSSKFSMNVLDSQGEPINSVPFIGVPVAATVDSLWLWESSPWGRSSLGPAITSPPCSAGQKNPLFDNDGLLLWKMDFATGELTRAHDVFPDPPTDLLFEGVLPDDSLVFSTADSLIIVNEEGMEHLPVKPFFTPVSAPNIQPFRWSQVQGGRVMVSQESGCMGVNVRDDERGTDAYWLHYEDKTLHHVDDAEAHSMYIAAVGPECELAMFTTRRSGDYVSFIINPLREIASWELTEDYLAASNLPRDGNCSPDLVDGGRLMNEHLLDGESGIAIRFPSSATEADGQLDDEPMVVPSDVEVCRVFFKRGMPSIPVESVFWELAEQQGLPSNAISSMIGQAPFDGGLTLANAGFGRAVMMTAYISEYEAPRLNMTGFRQFSPVVFDSYPHHLVDYMLNKVRSQE